MNYILNSQHSDQVLAAAIIYLVLFVFGIGALIYTGGQVDGHTWIPKPTVLNILAVCYVFLVYIVGPIVVFCICVVISIWEYYHLQSDETAPLLE